MALHDALFGGCSSDDIGMLCTVPPSHAVHRRRLFEGGSSLLIIELSPRQTGKVLDTLHGTWDFEIRIQELLLFFRSCLQAIISSRSEVTITATVIVNITHILRVTGPSFPIQEGLISTRKGSYILRI